MYESIVWLLVGLILGVVVSIIYLRPIERANQYLLLLRGKAVRGSEISGFIQNTEKQRRRLEEIYLNDSYLNEGKDDVITFNLMVPYPNLDKNMSLRRAQDDIVAEALFNKIGKRYRVGITSYRLTISNKINNIIIPIEKLDLEPGQIEIDK